MAPGPATVPDFDLSPEDAARWAARMAGIWTAYLERLPDLPVGPSGTPGEVRDRVTVAVPDEPMDPDETDRWLRELALTHSTQVGHGGFMAYVSGAGTIPGAAASLLAAGLNQNTGGWPLGPGASEVETGLLAWFAERLGMPASTGGAFVSGGATANLVALTVARDSLAGWDVRREGVAAGPPLAVYASAEVHDTIDRAADMLGLGSDAVRRIAVDGRLRMRPDALLDAIEDDLGAGVRPLCVVGTAGTTGVGAIDPLDRLAEVAAEHGCWFHVDAAYGGPAAMVPDLRDRFAGIGRADSVTLDPHKWMNTPIPSSLVLVADPERQHAAFTLEPAYTRQDPDAEDVGVMRYQWTPQFTRPFSALPVLVSLLAHGWRAYRERIVHDVALARWLHDRCAEHPELEPLHEPDLSIVCFRYVPTDLRDEGPAAEYLDQLNERIHFALRNGGRVFPSNASIDGRYAVRACLIGYRTEVDDLEALVDETIAAGRRLDGELRPAALG